MSNRLEYLGPGTFAENATNLWHQGVAVVPAHGKAPAIKGWHGRKSRYGVDAIINFGIKMPEANIAYQPGLSIPTGDEEYRLLVLDCDDLESVDQINRLFGEAPGTWTRRGRHSIFKVHYTELDEVTRLVGAGGNLRKVGLNVDLKHGSSIVMAGGSWHPDGSQYKWDGPDVHGDRIGGGFLGGAPKFNVTVLGDLVGVRSRLVSVDGAPVTHDGSDAANKANAPQEGSNKGEGRNGSRMLALNDHLISRVSGLGSVEELLECARAYNAEHCSQSPKGMLEDNIVEKKVCCMWLEHLANPKSKWSGGPAAAQLMPWELDGKAFDPRIGRNTIGHAVQLLGHLRVCHGAKPGKCFAISAEAMARDVVFACWKRDQYIKAREALIDVGFLKKVSGHSLGIAAQYKLTPMRLHPLGRSKR